MDVEISDLKNKPFSQPLGRSRVPMLMRRWNMSTLPTQKQIGLPSVCTAYQCEQLNSNFVSDLKGYEDLCASYSEVHSLIEF